MALTRPRAYQIYDIDYKQAVRVITLTSIVLSGGAPNSVDGVSLNLNDRVLVAGQSSGAQNGIYYVTTLGSGSNGTWARSVDTDTTGELLAGTIVMVTEGTQYQDTQWKLTTNNPIVIGTTPLTFVQNYSTNSISAGTSNVVVTSNSNVTISSAGTANVVVVTSTGANVAGAVRATGDVFGKELWSNQSSGDEGGQVNLGIPATNTSLTGQVVIDVYQNRLRFFQGDNARGAYIDLTQAGAGVSTNLLAGGGGGTPGGSNTQVQFNDGGLFGGSAGLTFNKTTNALATTGTFSATGNITGGNLNVTNDIFDTGPLRIITGSSGAISLAPNASNVVVVSTTGASVTGTMSATGNASGGNVTTTGIFSGAGGLQAWSTTTPGLGLGGLHLGSASGTTNAGPAITFGARDASSGTNAQAGIYINSDGSYGTRMYFATTDSYVTGSRVSSYIDHSGIFYVNVRNSATAIANGGTNGVGNIGASGASFNTVFARATSAQYADLAEMYQGDSSYAPGTVVEFGGEHEVTITTTESSTRIAGVVSTNPSYLMNCELNGVNAVAVALTGRVPCQVLGPVRKGDRLVSSSIPGVAHAIDESIYRPGCIIGKSLEDWTEATITSIEVVVGRL
jgi:hypothetical protein